LAGLAYGAAQPLQWGAAARNVDFFDVKGDLQHLFPNALLEFSPSQHPALHPGRAATVRANGVDIGVVGELHPKLRQAYGLPNNSSAPIVFELDAAACLAQQFPAFTPVARFQPVQRDLSVVVRQTTSHAALLAAVKSVNHSNLIRSCTLFDTYKPKQPVADMAADEHSIAVRFELLDDCSTLTDVQIDAVMSEILLSLQQQLGARLRA
jgi:phenylalanyl-tRNA synthetase beta chain